mmetsp:Transcript_72195/g.167308  ORF Transcript_72195/g.167308 Transcript_72195/m.167308 type:complete len:362 (+) Transcript_72195:354-1439(+)
MLPRPRGPRPHTAPCSGAPRYMSCSKLNAQENRARFTSSSKTGGPSSAIVSAACTCCTAVMAEAPGRPATSYPSSPGGAGAVGSFRADGTKIRASGRNLVGSGEPTRFFSARSSSEAARSLPAPSSMSAPRSNVNTNRWRTLHSCNMRFGSVRTPLASIMRSPTSTLLLSESCRKLCRPTRPCSSMLSIRREQPSICFTSMPSVTKPGSFASSTVSKSLRCCEQPDPEVALAALSTGLMLSIVEPLACCSICSARCKRFNPGDGVVMCEADGNALASDSTAGAGLATVPSLHDCGGGGATRVLLVCWPGSSCRGLPRGGVLKVLPSPVPENSSTSKDGNSVRPSPEPRVCHIGTGVCAAGV